jgi:hypothetical protein
VFLGSRAYIGSGGGGVGFDIPVDDQNQFSTTFTIPETYRNGETPKGGDSRQPPEEVAVVPGADYYFAVYPAGVCAVPFTVT